MAVKGHSLKLHKTSEPVALLQQAPVKIRYIEEKTPFLIRIFMIKNSIHLYWHTQFIVKQKHWYPKSSTKRTPDFKYIWGSERFFLNFFF